MEHKFELNLLKTKSNTEKNIESTALLMRENKRHETHYALSPSVQDLNETEIKITDYFLNTLLSGCSNGSSSWVNRVDLSLKKQLVDGISNGSITSPKIILYPYAVKHLKNSTKLVTKNNQLDHRIT